VAKSTARAEDGLDAVLHQPVRTQVVAYLVGRGEATFSELKRVLAVSDGNLESHLKKLIAADYVATRRQAGDARPQTVYSLTKAGESALRRYTATLQRMLGLGVKANARGQSASLPWPSTVLSEK
jgi:DNA-binding MarR family transcriptional regulator